MENVIAVGLTLFFVFIITKFNKFFRKRALKKITYSQSDIHNLIKDFIPKEIFSKPKTISQSRKHAEENTVKVIIIDGNAYWVRDNIFYTAETKNGVIIHESTKPVDIGNMPKKELDKMLFILDNLDRGKNNDSSGSGNE